MRRSGGALRRFDHYEAEPARTSALADSHPAVVEGRTLFPTTVAGAFESRRYLVSGKNSSKIGAEVLKGPWAGMPIFTLTLEERATCPRSCVLWNGCYGNAMQWARRNDALDPDFIPALKAEVITLVREACAPLHNKPKFVPPKGIVIRLHVLGDFYSERYVAMWAKLMKFLPELHVFGYTAREGDPIAAGIAELNAAYPDRWLIRTSHAEVGPGRAVVFEAASEDPDVIMCPAEVGKTVACATCGLCWSQSALPKTIGFLRHGQKTRPMGAAARGRSTLLDDRGLSPAAGRLYDAMLKMADKNGLVAQSKGKIALEAAIGVGTWAQATAMLTTTRRLQPLRPGKGQRPPVYRVFAEPQAEFPPAPALPLPVMPAKAPIKKWDGRPPAREAKAAVARAPDEPLMKRRINPEPRYHPRTGVLLNPQIFGTADQFDIGTAEERIAALDDDEKARIAAQYGAPFKGSKD